MDASVVVTAQVDHAGQLLRPALAGVDVVPQVFVHAQAGHTGEPGLIIGGTLQDRRHAGPHGPPRRAQLAGQPGDRGVFATQLLHHPAARPSGEHRPRLGHPVVLLGEHPHRTRRLRARPSALAPPHHRRHPEARRVDQPDRPPAVGTGHDPARGAAPHRQWRLDYDLQPAGVALHPDYVEAGKAHQQVTAVTVGIVGVAARRATRRLGHSRGPRGQGVW